MPTTDLVGPVLVTGANGFLGSYIVEELLAAGVSVVATDLDMAGARPLPVAVQTLDIRDTERFVQTIEQGGVKRVVNAAGIVPDSNAVKNPMRTLEVNCMALWALLLALRTKLPDVRVVTISTRAIYGAYLPSEGPLGEASAPRPEGIYGASKAAADVVAVAMAEQLQANFVAARVTGLFGPYQRHANPLFDMASAAVEGRTIDWPAGGGATYEFNSAAQTAKAVLPLLGERGLKHRIYNVGSGQVQTLNAVADLIRAEIPGAKIDLGPGYFPNIAPRAAMDVARYREEFPSEGRFDFRAGLQDLLAWLRTSRVR